MDPIRFACLQTLEGLLQIIPQQPDPSDSPTSIANTKWMAEHCISNLETMPIDKLNRWIGFIQGVLACHGLLDVRTERDRTRPFFHAAYAATGQATPVPQERQT